MIVVDASVAAKLYREEAGSVQAEALIATHAGALLAPDIFAVELAGVIVRDANADKATAALQRDKLAHLEAFLAGPAIALVRTAPAEMARAAELAMQLGHPLKDCLYLALAIERDCPLVTADERFAEKARWAYPRIRGIIDA